MKKLRCIVLAALAALGFGTAHATPTPVQSTNKTHTSATIDPAHCAVQTINLDTNAVNLAIREHAQGVGLQGDSPHALSTADPAAVNVTNNDLAATKTTFGLTENIAYTTAAPAFKHQGTAGTITGNKCTNAITTAAMQQTNTTFATYGATDSTAAPPTSTPAGQFASIGATTGFEGISGFNGETFQNTV